MLVTDPDPEIAGNATRLIGETNPAGSWIRERVQDRNSRVQLLAIEGLAKAVAHVAPAKREVFVKAASSALLEVLKRNQNQDAHLRHVAVFALARIGDLPALLAAAKDESPAVRMGVCLACAACNVPRSRSSSTTLIHRLLWKPPAPSTTRRFPKR